MDRIETQKDRYFWNKNSEHTSQTRRFCEVCNPYRHQAVQRIHRTRPKISRTPGSEHSKFARFS